MASRAKMTQATAHESGVAVTDPRQQQQQQQEQQQQQQVAAPTSDRAPDQPKLPDVLSTNNTASQRKRDKMAALAARSNKSPMKNDDIDASSQSNQQKNQPGSSATPSTSPLRIDKMNAQSDRASFEANKSSAEMLQMNDHQQPQKQNSGNSTTMISAAPRRNKLAALASRSMTNSLPVSPPVHTVPSRNNKLAKLAAANQASGSSGSKMAKTKSKKELAKDAAIAKEKHLGQLKERLSKRRGILDRLDRAEKLTCKLLKIAAKTTDSLQELNYSAHLCELSVAYRSTIQELHPLLTTGTEELIKAYQNHTKETKQSMYAARVEMRLAKERVEVLKTFSQLEMARKDEDDVVAMNARSTYDRNLAMNCNLSDRKRKR